MLYFSLSRIYRLLIDFNDFDDFDLGSGDQGDSMFVTDELRMPISHLNGLPLRLRIRKSSLTFNGYHGYLR